MNEKYTMIKNTCDTRKHICHFKKSLFKSMWNIICHRNDLFEVQYIKNGFSNDRCKYEMELFSIWSCNLSPVVLVLNFEYQFCFYFIRYLSILKDVKSSNTFSRYCVYIIYIYRFSVMLKGEEFLSLKYS